MLTLEDIHVYYGNIHALKGVSMEIKKGEIVTLIGANGAGKSTTLRAIAGLNPPRKGRILYEGQPVDGISTPDRVGRGLVLCPEGRQIFANLSVAENLAIGGYLRKDKKEVQQGIEHAYELFPRLKERQTQLGGTLSGGEQQMLAVGRALISKPKVLLFDEPSLGLAPLIVKRIFEIIERINREAGITVLLIEQNAHLALRLASRAYVIETGKITMSGPADELLNDSAIQEAYLGL